MRNYLLMYFAVLISFVVFFSSAQRFYAGGRYGKRTETDFSGQDDRDVFSGGSSLIRNNDRATRPKLRVVARNDRFFIGSRYGKRTDPPYLLDYKDMIARSQKNVYDNYD